MNTDKGRCPLCLSEEDYWEISNWRQKYLNKNWLNKDKEIDYKEIIIKGKGVL